MTSHPMQDIYGDYTSPSGTVFSIEPGACYLKTRKRNADNQPTPYKSGLGSWWAGIQIWDDQCKHACWVYIAPSRIEYLTFFYLARYPQPPPLPQPVAARAAHVLAAAPISAPNAVSPTSLRFTAWQMGTVPTVATADNKEGH
jgi:hypothetical protein